MDLIRQLRRLAIALETNIFRDQGKHLRHDPHSNHGTSGQRSFARRTDRFRTPDGRPICFSCSRAGHVQRYCRSLVPGPRFVDRTFRSWAADRMSRPVAPNARIASTSATPEPQIAAAVAPKGQTIATQTAEPEPQNITDQATQTAAHSDNIATQTVIVATCSMATQTDPIITGTMATQTEPDAVTDYGSSRGHPDALAVPLFPPHLASTDLVDQCYSPLLGDPRYCYSPDDCPYSQEEPSLPLFYGDKDEDAVAWKNDFETRCSNWTDWQKRDAIPLVLKENALRWFRRDECFMPTWRSFVAEFTDAFIHRSPPPIWRDPVRRTQAKPF